VQYFEVEYDRKNICHGFSMPGVLGLRGPC
jgi:hypothetical protein